MSDARRPSMAAIIGIGLALFMIHSHNKEVERQRIQERNDKAQRDWEVDSRLRAIMEESQDRLHEARTAGYWSKEPDYYPANAQPGDQRNSGNYVWHSNKGATP